MLNRLIAICSIAFLSSCAIYKAITQPVYSPQIGDRYEMIIEKKGPAESTFPINNKLFVQFDSDEILFFEDGILKSKINVDQGQTYRVEVDSLSSNENIKYQTVKIIPNMPGVTQNDLVFKNLKKHIQMILEKKKLIIVEDDKEPDVILGVAYGISDPRVELKTISSPIWGYDSGKVINSSISNKYGNSVNIQTVIPGQGLHIAGHQTQTYTLTTYNRYLTLKAISGKEFKKNKEIVELFSYSANSVGPSNDLRLLLPALITPFIHWFNKDSQQKIYYEENDATLPIWAMRNFDKISNY